MFLFSTLSESNSEPQDLENKIQTQTSSASVTIISNDDESNNPSLPSSSSISAQITLDNPNQTASVSTSVSVSADLTGPIEPTTDSIQSQSHEQEKVLNQSGKNEGSENLQSSSSPTRIPTSIDIRGNRNSRFHAALNTTGTPLPKQEIKTHLYHFGVPDDDREARPIAWRLALDYLPWHRADWDQSLARSSNPNNPNIPNSSCSLSLSLCVCVCVFIIIIIII